MAELRIKLQLFLKIFNVMMTILSITEAGSFFPSSNTTNSHILPYTTLCNFIDYSPNSTIICVKGYISNFTNENRRRIPFPIVNRNKRQSIQEHVTGEDSNEDILFEINFNDTDTLQEEKLFDEPDNNYILTEEDLRSDDQSSEDAETNDFAEKTSLEHDIPGTNQISEEKQKLASKFIGIIQVKVPHFIRPYFWRPEATENANNHDFTNTGFKVPNFLALPSLFWDRLNRRGSALLGNAQNAIFGSGNWEGHEEYPAAFRNIEDIKHKAEKKSS